MIIINALMLSSILALFAKFLGIEAATYTYNQALYPIYLIIACAVAFGIFATVMECRDEIIKNKNKGEYDE